MSCTKGNTKYNVDVNVTVKKQTTPKQAIKHLFERMQESDYTKTHTVLLYKVITVH